MTNFWSSGTGKAITGDADSAFLPEFSIIPDGTTAKATIKTFEVVEKEATQYAAATRFLQITYKILDGSYKGREVTQKIKVFDGKPEQIDRNLNMLKLIMQLCNCKPTHAGEPTDADLAVMHGHIVGIKIREWSLPRADGSIMDGNFVCEVHPTANFETKTGVKLEVVHTRDESITDSAFSRNDNLAATASDDDIPF